MLEQLEWNPFLDSSCRSDPIQARAVFHSIIPYDKFLEVCIKLVDRLLKYYLEQKNELNPMCSNGSTGQFLPDVRQLCD